MESIRHSTNGYKKKDVKNVRIKYLILHASSHSIDTKNTRLVAIDAYTYIYKRIMFTDINAYAMFIQNESKSSVLSEFG